MPQKGKYRLARMHAKLLPEFTTINKQRDDMIMAYDAHVMNVVHNEDGTMASVESPEYCVPEGKMDEFTAAWRQIGEQEIEVDIEPISLEQLDLGGHEDGAISAVDLITLGDLVTE